MNPARSRIRLAHIGVAAFTAGVVYSPSFDAQTVRMLLQLAVLPALTLSGATLWALPKLRRLIRRRAESPGHSSGPDCRYPDVQT